MLYTKLVCSSVADEQPPEDGGCVVDTRLLADLPGVALTGIKLHNVSKGIWLQAYACARELTAPLICLHDDMASSFERGDLCVIYAVDATHHENQKGIPFVFGRYLGAA